MSPVSVLPADEKVSSPPRASDETRTAAEAEAPEQNVTVIEAEHPWWPLVNFSELWRHREMLYSLTLREIMRRYKQTSLGILWVILPILGNTLVVSFFFGQLIKGNTEGLPYPLYIFTGLLPWYLFLSIVMGATHSVINHPDLIGRVYFPRLILPLSSIGDRVLDFIIGLAGLLVVQAIYGLYMPDSDLILLPVVTLGLILAGLGVGLMIGAAGVAYRDAFNALSLITQFWFFATPSIFFDKGLFSKEIQPWLALNPAFGLIVNFRAAMTPVPADYLALGVSLGVSVLLFVGGLVYFQRAERHFADVI